VKEITKKYTSKMFPRGGKTTAKAKVFYLTVFFWFLLLLLQILSGALGDMQMC